MSAVRFWRSLALSFGLAVIMAGAAATLGFVAGRQAADAPAAYDRGAREGERFGRTEAQSEYRRGKPAYRQIFRRGQRNGFARGRLAGSRDGRTAGRDATFAGFPGGWEIGRWYVINVAPGADGGKYAIGGRVPVKGGRWYGICTGGGFCIKRKAAFVERQ